MPAGWYPDPSGRFEQRYYDGANWTMSVAAGGRSFLEQAVQTPNAKVEARPWAIATLVGGGLAAIAAFLPWAKATVLFFTATQNGIDGDGVKTLIGGAFVVLFSLIQLLGHARNDKWPYVVNLVAALGITSIAGYDLVDIANNGADLVEPGSGLYLTAIAGVIVLVGSVGGLAR
jgi:uncharacterized protein DUF2510